MTADRLPRRMPISPALAALAVLPLLAAGCGSSGSPSRGSSTSTVSARETAEIRLASIGPQLGTVLADYRSGKKQQAYTLAKSVSTNLYEGTTEGIVAGVDPAGERQIDPLLAATLPYAIQNGESVSQVAALIHQARALAASCLASIDHSEGP